MSGPATSPREALEHLVQAVEGLMDCKSCPAASFLRMCDRKHLARLTRTMLEARVALATSLD